MLVRKRIVSLTIKKILISVFIVPACLSFGQENGYIIKGNDTTRVLFKIKEIHAESFSKIERLQTSVTYKRNGKTKTSNAWDIDGFCINNFGKYYCFDAFRSTDKKEASFLFRVAGKKDGKCKAYQFYTSGFYGVNYNWVLHYRIHKLNQPDYTFTVVNATQWKESLLKIVEDCPAYHEYVNKNVQRIESEFEFEKYLNEYIKMCNK